MKKKKRIYGAKLGELHKKNQPELISGVLFKREELNANQRLASRISNRNTSQRHQFVKSFQEVGN